MSGTPQATGVRLDPRCGHVSLHGESGPALVTLTDLGGVLHFWPWEGAEIGPEVAREFAAALTEWADRTERKAA